MVKDGGIFGDGVNVAARLEALANPGSICTTRGVRDQVRDLLNYAFEDLGEHAVKNIARPIRVFGVLFDADSEVPVPSTNDASPEAASSSKVLSSEDVADEIEPVEMAFWTSVEGKDLHDEYAAYLDRYPDGVFSSLAKSRLSRASVKNPDHQKVDPSVELAFWDTVRSSADPVMYEAYLEKFPKGEFCDLARIKLSGLNII